MRNAFVLTVFAVFYLPIISSSIRRATECSPELKSRALIIRESYDAAPGKLGAMLFERSEGMLSADEVREIAKGFARVRKEDENWAEAFIDGYLLYGGSGN